MSPQVKICGLTRSQDLEAVIAHDVWAVGFMLWDGSKRAIDNNTLRQLTQVASKNAPTVLKVGVFVNPDRDAVLRGVDAGIDICQFHGDESPEFCQSFGVDYIKAFRPKQVKDLAVCADYDGAAYFLIDAYVAGAFGGTGQAVSEDILRKIGDLKKPTLVAGGINPQNIATLHAKLQPFGFDLASGVETAPGIKSPKLIAQLFGQLEGKSL